jgi:CRP/FNR family cyclic AMP-dependent transcriptional regulator
MAKTDAATERRGTNDLFGDLSPEELAEIDRLTVTRAYPRGSVLYTPGETGDALFLLREGSVQIYRMSAEGRKLIIAHLLPVSFFGEMTCIGQGMYDAYAETTEESLLTALNCAHLERLLATRPQVARRILEAFGRRVLEAEQQLEEMVFKGLVARVASLLLREAVGDEVAGLSHQEIAERLGVYRETATNALHELKAAGAVSVARRRIRILDRQRLERLAAG